MGQGRKSTRELKCILTGNVLLASKDYYASKLEKYDGDEEKMLRTYVSRKALGLLKRGYSVDKIRELLAPDKNLPDIAEDLIAEVLEFNKISSVRFENRAGTDLEIGSKTDPEVAKYIEKVCGVGK